MATLSDLYGHLKTLVEQWCYNKSQIDTSLGGKVDKETGKGLSTNDYTTEEKNKLSGIEAQANKTVIDSALSSTSTNPLQNKAINTALSNKADSSSVPTKTSDLTNDGADGTNVFVANNDSRLSDSRTPTSHTHGNLSNDGKIGSNANYFVYTGTGGAVTSKQKIGNITTSGAIGSTANKPLITTTSGVITTGSFGTTANTFCQGNDSRLSDARTPTSHNQASSTITDSNTYSNIGNSNGTQDSINSAIDTKLGQLQQIKALEMVSTLPTASASTMGILYVINENSKINFYYTENSGTAQSPVYAWHKMDTEILDELVVSWNDVQDKPSDFIPASHSHGNLSNDGVMTDTPNTSINNGYLLVTGSDGVIKRSQTIYSGFMKSVTGYDNIGTNAQDSQYTINGAIDTALGNKISKSQTSGLVKNDGTIDTTTYLSSLPSHSHGNILNGGTCTTDVTFNSKILVTNSSNAIGTSTAIDVLDSVVQSLISYGSS